MILPSRRVVVTGIGAITPLGNSFATTWKNVLDPKQQKHEENHRQSPGITSLEEALSAQQLSEEQFDREWSVAQHLPCQVAAAVHFPIPIDSGRTGRFVQFALHAAEEAIKQAKLHSWLSVSADQAQEKEDDEAVTLPSQIRQNRERIGSAIGSGMSGVRDLSDASFALYGNHVVSSPSKRIRTISPYFVPKILPNSTSGRIGVHYKLYGPALSPSTACAAGAHAIGDAFRCIQYNDADIMIAGGAESCIDPISMAGFCRLRAMSTKFNDTPTLASRPFDSHRDGFVMGEGAAILVLEEREHALQRGVPILCELVGYGIAGDGYHITSPDVNGQGAERAMRAAIHRAGFTASDVDYINAHATSTPLGDGIEASAIDRIVRDDSARAAIHRVAPLMVSSTKGATGHLLGAAGALEAAFTCMAVRDAVIPPTWNLEDGSSCMGGISSFHLVSEEPSVASEIHVAVSNSFGFGGTNASLAFKKHDI